MGSKMKEAPDDWRTVIVDAKLNDDRFRVQVCIMESAGSEEDRLYLRKFENYASELKRFVIKNICKTETMFMINQLGGEKKVDNPNLRVFEEGQVYLKDKQDIPPDILALIIKHLIIKMKHEYLTIKRQKIEVKEGIRLESNIMLTNTEVRGLDISSVLPEPEPPTPRPKKGQEPVDSLELPPTCVPGKKYNTILRVAGEEWRDKVYVDDFPLDGPNIYVCVTGFDDPLLLISLVKIGVPLKATVQIRIDVASNKSLSSLIKSEQRGQSQKECLTEKSLQFWKDLQELRINKDTADFFKGTAFIIYYPTTIESDVESGDSELFYDELSWLLYDIQDLSRQHMHYLDNMHVSEIPGTNDNNDCYVSYYGRNIADIPLESITIYNILESILRTVSDSEEEVEVCEHPDANLNEVKICANKKIELAENFVNNFFETFHCAEGEKKVYRLTFGEEYENYSHPTIISYGDFAKCYLFNVENIDCDNIIYSALSKTPINILWDRINDVTDDQLAKITLHLNLLLSCFDRKSVNISELYRLILILACRKVYNNRSSLRKKYFPQSSIEQFKKIYLKRSIMISPLKRLSSVSKNMNTLARSFSKIEQFSCQNSSEPSDFESDCLSFIYECPDIIELVSATEVANQKPIDHMIDDYEYFEDFSGTNSLQILMNAFNDFNCVDYKYSEVTDSITLMFHNSFDNNGISYEEWRAHLSTPVCLQDFFDFILDEYYEWIFNEDKIKDEKMAFVIPSEDQRSTDVVPVAVCLENKEVSNELLIEGSIKYQSQLAECDVSDKASFPNPNNSQPSLKTKSPLASPKSKLPAPIVPPVPEVEKEIEEIQKKPFFGYNLGDRRVEAFGRDSAFFSEDGTRVFCTYLLFIPMNFECLTLNISPGNRQNEFWVHKLIGNAATPDQMKNCESFRIICKNQMLINVVNNSYEVDKSGIKFDSAISMDLEPETKHFHSLYITWPNGLITQTVHQRKSPKISHIKQFHITSQSHLEETMRCISLSGEVIIFKKSGDIEVLRPDGTYIKITQCNMMKNESEELPGPGKNVEPKQSEYELNIGAFEIIETNGIRSIYANNLLLEIEKYLLRCETEYCLTEKYIGANGTSTLFNKNGTVVVTFPNGTRILTDFIIEDNEIYIDCSEEGIESPSSTYSRSENEDDEGFISVLLIFTIEHDNFNTVTINKCNKNIVITSPNETTVIIDENLNYEMKLDTMTNANFDGNRLQINYEACAKCNVYTKCDVNITNTSGFPLEDNVEEIWVASTDSHAKSIFINMEGNIFRSDKPNNYSTTEKGPRVINRRLENCNCAEICHAKAQRFFILKRDLSCSELLHRTLVRLYEKSCSSRKWCSIATHRELSGFRTLTSIFKPLRTQTEKWIMDSIAVPKIEIKKETKGHYHWMRPHGRFVPQPHNPCKEKFTILPNGFTLRLLELQWVKHEFYRSRFKGAKELLKAILEYRNIVLTNEINERKISIRYVPRPSILSSHEKEYVADVVFHLCNDLKIFLKRDMLSRKKLTITTKPPPKKELVSLDDEIANVELREQQRLEIIREKERVLKAKRRARYWAKRAEQLKEEEFYLYYLRNPQIPRYFLNMLGGAVWWDLNYIAGVAVDISHNKYNQRY